MLAKQEAHALKKAKETKKEHGRDDDISEEDWDQPPTNQAARSDVGNNIHHAHFNFTPTTFLNSGNNTLPSPTEFYLSQRFEQVRPTGYRPLGREFISDVDQAIRLTNDLYTVFDELRDLGSDSMEGYTGQRRQIFEADRTRLRADFSVMISNYNKLSNRINLIQSKL